MRLLIASLLALTMLVAPADARSTAAGAAGTSATANEARAAAKKKCRKGYVRKRVRGKVRCVKKKRRAAPAPAPAPVAPSTITTDVTAVRRQFAGTLWFWTAFEQAGSGGTTDRTHVNLCADGTFRLRRSSTTEDGSGNSFTVIVEDLAPAWQVTSGSYDSATGDLEATITTTLAQRRERTARGSQFSEPNEPATFKLARRGGSAFLDDQPGFKLDEPPLCSFES